MKTILGTTYALNPYNGSEDGMGWNFVRQIARHHNVIAITRKNNREAIERYQQENPDPLYARMQFVYHDLPYWMRFWKRGSRGALLYYYLWQLSLPQLVKRLNLEFDIAHNLNFHNDWTPSFLWRLGKPMAWGPVGHHPKIPRQFLLPVYGWKAFLKDRLTWLAKQWFWRADPFLKLTRHNAKAIWCMHSGAADRLSQQGHKLRVLPSVASEDVEPATGQPTRFRVLSIGRFTPLKGFDVTLRAFAAFYLRLAPEAREHVTLTLVGKGPQKAFLERLAKQLRVAEAVEFIDWIERAKLANIYRSSSVFFFPSHEGAGMVVPEALSFGVPVLCFDNYGPGEIPQAWHCRHHLQPPRPQS
ncbi:MAG: glycosyltransferase, partial [Bacteroidota bacterium]